MLLLPLPQKAAICLLAFGWDCIYAIARHREKHHIESWVTRVLNHKEAAVARGKTEI